jgi:hypothetical protein
LKISKKLVCFSIGMSCLVVLATTYGPFIFATYYPGISRADDFELNYIYSQTIPRLVMNTSVQSIKKGDTVRIVYPDGSVYDFTQDLQCSYVTSPSCKFSRPVKVSSATAPSRITYWQEREFEDSCPPVRIEYIKTGYWASSTVILAPDRWQTTGTWISTGEQPYQTGGTSQRGCK